MPVYESTPKLRVGKTDFLVQLFWDLIIYDIFFKGSPKRMRRFFEAGARDGYTENNTLFFEKYLGRSGVLVEPTPLYRCYVVPSRPRSTVVHAAFCEEKKSSNWERVNNVFSTKRQEKHTDTFMKLPGPYAGFRRDLPKDGCEPTTEDWQAPCRSWQNMQSDFALQNIGLWSLDIDNDVVEKQIL